MRICNIFFSPSNKKKLKGYAGSPFRVLFLKESRILFYKYLKYVLFPFLFYPAVSALRRDKGAIWKQINYHKFYRSPNVLATFFSNSLRVCVTYKCNLSCHYCYVNGLENSIPADMPVGYFLKLVTWARDMRYNWFRFLGGEPTIHPGFIEMLRICYDNRISVSLSTNNTYSSQIAAKFDRSLLGWVSINYVFNKLDSKQKFLFKDNLARISALKIPFELSYVISHEDDDWSGIFRDAAIYRPIFIRVSVAIPGLSKQTSISELVGNFKLISKKLFEFQEKCLKINVPLYIYRPLMPCLFPAQDYRRLTKDFPFICYTRCPLGARGDYSATVVVNPDLSIFPCVSVFLKGPNILSFKNKKEISDFYKQNIKKMLTQPLMESCLTCDKRGNFMYNLDRGEKTDLKSCFKHSLCQGGCLSFKESVQSLCCAE